MKNKIKALLLFATMIISACAFTACGKENVPSKNPVDPAEITNGYYSFSYDAGTAGTAYRYLHFYEDTGLGQIVYAGAQTGTYTQMGKISYYTVTETSYEYKVWDTREGAAGAHGDGATDATIAEAEQTAIKGIAPYTITFKSISDNSVITTCGYDGKYLYSGLDIGFMPQAAPDTYTLRFTHDTESGNTVAPYNKEAPQAVATYYLNAENYIAINHDGSYTYSIFADAADYVTVADGYKYTYANNVFTLKDDEDTTLATVVKSGGKILYKVSGQDDIELSTDSSSSKPLPTGKVLVKDVLDTEASAAWGNYQYGLTLYSDLTFEISNISGVAAEGTWSYASYVLTLEMTIYDIDGSVTATKTVSTDTSVLATKGFVISVDIGFSDGVESVFTMSSDLSAKFQEAMEANASAEKTVLYTLTGTAGSGAVSGVLKLYDDGTCEYNLNDGTVVVNGVYTTEEFYGQQMPKTVTLEGYDAVTFATDFTAMTLSVTMPQLSGVPVSVTVSMNLPTA